MRSSLPIIAGLLAISGPASAAPTNNAVPEPQKMAAVAELPRAPIVLASADPLHATAADAGQSAGAVVKRRIAPRITTCRCGPVQPQPQPEPDEE